MIASSSHRSRAHVARRWVVRALWLMLALVLVLGLGVWLAGMAAQSRLAQRYPAPGQLIDVGGYAMHIHCMGEGSPSVILEAGINDFSLVWYRVQPEAAKVTRVCVYDRAGFGWSEPSPYPRTSETMVKELHTLLSHAQIEPPFVLVGHSLGGVLVRLYAYRYPDEIAGLVLVDSAHEELPLRVPALEAAAQPVLRLFTILARLRPWGLLALIPEQIPARGLTGEALDQYRAILATSPYFETARAETRSAGDSYGEVRAAQIVPLEDIPLVVISRGLADPPPGFSAAESRNLEEVWQALQTELALQSPERVQIIAEQSAHYIQLTEPNLVIDAIRRVVLAIRG